MRSAYHLDSEGQRVVFIDPLFDYKEEQRSRRFRLFSIVSGCISLVFLVISVLSVL